MTNEERDKTIEFILDQQARVSVRLEQVGEKLDSLTEQVSTLTADVTALNEVTQTHSQTMERVAVIVAQLAEAQLLTNRSQALTNERLQALAEAQLRTQQSFIATDERLNSFIRVVEKYITENRHGQN